MQEKFLFEYAVLRVVPKVEREEFLNVGVVLYCPKQKFLQVLFHLDGERIKAFSCELDIPEVGQNLQAFVITPICPHTLTNRPLVDCADSIYTLSSPEFPRGATLVIDGQVKEPLRQGDRVEVRRAPVSFQLARLPDHSFYATLHRKLGWGGQTYFKNRESPSDKS